jgi:FKBP-type peptidyl-prolyl cis-trans isomerase
MIHKSISLAAVMALLSSAAPLAAQTEVATAPIAVAPTQAEMVEAFGYFSAFQLGIKQLGFEASDSEAILKGFSAALKDAEPSAAMLAVVQNPAFQAFIQARMATAQAAAEAEAANAAGGNIAAGKAYIEDLKSDDALQSTESGLHFKVLEAGADDKPGMEDTVLVHYRGTRIDGTEFDSSYTRGEPASFPLNGVVPGFGEGLTKIGTGGKIILYIPSELGYGNNPRPGGAIQPGDTLVFECELIEVNPGS